MAHYLSLGISPKFKVSCRGGPITTLHIPLWKQHVFASKPYAHTLWEWSKVLLKRGFSVPYCGESLSVYTHAVIMALVKTSGTRSLPIAAKKSLPSTKTDAPSAVTSGTYTITFWSWATLLLCATAATMTIMSWCRCAHCATVTNLTSRR